MNIKLHALTFALLAATAGGAVQAQDLKTTTEVAAQAQVQAQVDAKLASDAATRAQQEARDATDAAVKATDAAVNATAAAHAATSPPASDVAVEQRSDVSTELHTATSVATTTQAGSQVTVNSGPSNSVVGEYKIDFATLDRNRDGSLNRNEASANATLMGEFRAVDSNHNGRLSKDELKGWM